MFCKYFVVSVEEATEKYHRRNYEHGCKVFTKQNVYILVIGRSLLLLKI